MADLLKQELAVADVQLITGKPGEFSVWVDEAVVAKKNWLGFPDDRKIISAVRQALDG